VAHTVSDPHAPSEKPVLEDRVRVLCRTAFEAMVLVDDGRRYVYVNDGAADILGAPPEVVVGRRLDDFTPPNRLSRVEPYWTALRQGGALEGRGPVRRYDGSQGMVEFRARWSLAPSLHLIVLREIRAPALEAEAAAGRDIPALTPREREVLQRAADGCSTDEIAAALVISPGTVKTHFQHIYDKLAARDRVSAVAKAFRLGLIS